MLLTKPSKHEIDMTVGNLFPQIISFAIPLVLTSILQLLFNSADMIVVGKFVSNDAVGAVGATGALNSLIINLAIGLSGGAGVVLSSAYGAKKQEYAHKVLHTAMVLSVISGVLIAVVGCSLARTLLTLMHTNAEHIDYATTYLQIIFLGAPFNTVYNFGASMLRAVGDTKRPLMFLTLSGVINIIVNIVSVVVFKMEVAGVALATIISQAISAFLVVITLCKSKGFIKLSFKDLKIDSQALKEILRYGVPSGIQGALFSITNVLLQSAINAFGSTVANGSAVSAQIEGYVYATINAITLTGLTAVGQNYGAKNYTRIRKAVAITMALVVGSSLFVGWMAILLHTPLCRIFTDNSASQDELSQIIGYAFERMLVVCGTYFLDGVMEVVTFSLRGIGYSITSMLIVLVGTCIYRVIWIYLVFPNYKEFWFLLSLYPISWIITSTTGAIWLAVKLHKDGKKYEKTDEAPPDENMPASQQA